MNRAQSIKTYDIGVAKMRKRIEKVKTTEAEYVGFSNISKKIRIA
jgi:hypothetical protein